MNSTFRWLVYFCIQPMLPSGVPAEEYTLVRARVSSITRDAASSTTIATLEIIHVYAGDTTLVKKTFVDSYSRVDFHGVSAHEDFVQGEEGIWTVKAGPNGPVLANNPRLPFRFRSRNVKGGDGTRHTEILKLAESIEKYTKTRPEEQPALAEKLAQDSNREVCYWMVTTLGDSESKASRDLLAKLKKKSDLPLMAQIALDEVFCAKDREDWFFSSDRTALLKSWVSGKADEYHAHQILRRLDISTQSNELHGGKAIELIQIAALNKDWRKKDRLNAFSRIGLHASRLVDHQAAYDWMFEQMRTNPEFEARLAAAQIVGSLSNYPKRLKAVEEYLATEKDQMIAAALRDAVKDAKERERK